MKYWGRNPTWQRLAPSVTQPVRSNWTNKQTQRLIR
jgi:hypothetical protein